MPSRRNKGGLLARVNFPLYTLQMLTSRHILVGGGGGSSKTGVANGFEIFELLHDGVQFIAEEVTRHETGPIVVMNCATYNNAKRSWILAGQENHCQLYNVNTKIVNLENGEIIKKVTNVTKDSVRNRKANEKMEEERKSTKGKIEEIKDDNSNIKNKRLQLVIKPVDSVQTDFSEDESLQRIVRISSNGKLMATGGTDGCIRIWKFPQLQKLHDLKAHQKEIDDIDFSPDGNSLITIAKDGKAILWDIASGSLNKELTWNSPNNAKYMYKRCRFRISEVDISLNQLFLLSNATMAKDPSFLQLWDTESSNIIKSITYKETLSALAVSDDGKFVAVGTMFSGSVDIYIAFSLRRVLHVPGAHNMFVTGLEFLPTKLDGPPITSNTETSVISISIDNRICIHSIPFRHTIPFWFGMFLIILCICAAFTFCSYLGI
ncbi:prolactin regulatory element-binding protein isoform X1 [Polistes fuscatus]|uniref:prolactin regulatory element-binding protein isoform X1 n=2 Tax=Polistes fuscatus TaxID=30207 RepID=UPI001CA92EF1|nr:prolactin regulatory element-binding protein isoform X1 [Polistes fuscatus]XP_043502467.1 prolactin regulatory element-binding protein isoform X1 [Polistes fuscatus]